MKLKLIDFAKSVLPNSQPAVVTTGGAAVGIEDREKQDDVKDENNFTGPDLGCLLGLQTLQTMLRDMVPTRSPNPSVAMHPV